jgi:L-lactate dehydrogenase (cytochrome)
MRDMSSVDTDIELFGHRLSMPVILGPVGFAGMYARRGEVQAARAAARVGTAFCLSTVSICPIEEVCEVAPPWFQLYAIKDRNYMRDILRRARECGSRVLVFTVDLPTPAGRYRDLRSGMMGKPGMRSWTRQVAGGLSRPAWLMDVWLSGRPLGFGNLPSEVQRSGRFAEAWDWIRNNFDATITWADLAFVRENWEGPIVIKGILDVDDAKEALAAGADGIVVSNHGGRQLDGVRSSVSALAPIVSAVAGRVPVLMDGGVRSGTDVLKALALGADSVLLGRAWSFALAAKGEAGVHQMLETFRQELRTAMILTGCRHVREAGRHLLD